MYSPPGVDSQVLPVRLQSRALQSHRRPTHPSDSSFALTDTGRMGWRFFHVAYATVICCNSNMEVPMNDILEALFHRRAVKVFEPVKIPQVLREQILDAARHAPSSFNMQPYRFFWVESSARMATAAKLCLGQMPAATASALVVAVADIGRWQRPRKPSWNGCGGADSATPKSETMSGRRRSAGSCSCQDRSAFLARSSGRFSGW